MDRVMFDRLARRTASILDRRALFGSAGGALLAAASVPLATEAKKGKKKCKKREKQCRADMLELCDGEPQECVNDIKRCCGIAGKCKSDQKVIACCENAGWCL